MTLAVLQATVDEIGGRMSWRLEGKDAVVTLRHPLIPTITTREWTLDDAVRAALRQLECGFAAYVASRPPEAWS